MPTGWAWPRWLRSRSGRGLICCADRAAASGRVDRARAGFSELAAAVKCAGIVRRDGTRSRRPPDSPVAAPSVSGVTTSMRPAARVRHETLMRCPTGAGCPQREVERCRRRGVATVWVDSCWVRSDHITIPSIHHSPPLVGPASRGGDRSRRHRLPGRFPVRHGLVVPDVLRCHAARSGRAAAIVLGRPDDRTGVSHGALTIASNSACSHSSSSQTNAQKSSSTAPEPSVASVFSRPSMPLTPRRSSKKPADVCLSM
jgi:hypothetical protein